MTPHISPIRSSTLRQLLGDIATERINDGIEANNRYFQFYVPLNSEEFNLSPPRRLFVLQLYLKLGEPFCTDEQIYSATTELLDYVLDFEVDWKHHEGILGIEVKPEEQRGMHHVDYYEQARGIDGTSYFLPGDNSGNSGNSLLAALKASLRMVLMQSLNDT